MSQVGKISDAIFPPGSVVQYLEGDVGGQIPPDATNTLYVLGDAFITTTGVPATNTITWALTDAIAAQYDCDAGSAVPIGNILNVLGDGANISTTGAGDTVTISLSGTTDHAVQIGNAAGNLTSLAVGTDGQVLIGATGADPAFATITSADGSISFTPGANTLI